MESASRTGPVYYRTAAVGGVNVFYREAGPDSGPVVLLLHGFPSSSRMFRDLIPRLSDAYRVIAPDYPAFGHSAVPGRSAFGYTFDHLADVVDGLLEQLGIGTFAIYVMDFGAAVGFRLALRHPERLTAIIVQNAPLHIWEPHVQVVTNVLQRPQVSFHSAPSSCAPDEGGSACSVDLNAQRRRRKLMSRILHLDREAGDPSRSWCA